MRCLRARSSWPKARSSTRDAGHEHDLRQQQHAGHQTGQLTDREHGGAAGEPGPEPAVGHPPVGGEQQPEPEQRTGGHPDRAVDRGPAGARSGSPWRAAAVWRAVMSPGCPFRRGSAGHRPRRCCQVPDWPGAAVGEAAAVAVPSKPAGTPCWSNRTSSSPPPAEARPRAKPPRPPASSTAAAPPATAVLARVSQGRRAPARPRRTPGRTAGRRREPVSAACSVGSAVGCSVGSQRLPLAGDVSSLMPQPAGCRLGESRGGGCQLPVNCTS